MYLYLETSVWNMLVDDDPVNAEKRRDTELLLNEAKSGKHELYVSDLVIKEINADRNLSHRSMLLDAVATAGPVVLAEHEEVLTLANTYVSSGIVPTRYIADGMHIAYAVSNALDAVISWTCGISSKSALAARFGCIMRPMDLMFPILALRVR